MSPSRNEVVSVSCLNPRTIVNRHYAIMDPADRYQYATQCDYFITIPCGRCRLCKSKWAREWKVRLHYELQSCPRHKIEGRLVPKCLLLTFTLNDKYVTDDEKFFAPWLVKFRDNYRKKFGSSPRYFATTDRGSQFGRLHLHMLLFNPATSASELHRLLGRWYPYGFHDLKWIYNDIVDEYLTGYLSGANMSKDEPVKHGKPICDKALRYKPRVFVSKGLGRDCVDNDYILQRDDNLVDINGFLYSLPRYYANKWYSEKERYYKRVINLHYCDYIASLYKYDPDAVKYRVRDRIVDYDTLQQLKQDYIRFESPDKQKFITDWSQYDGLEHDIINYSALDRDDTRAFYLHRQFMESFEHELDPYTKVFCGLGVNYSADYWYNLTKDFPF